MAITISGSLSPGSGGSRIVALAGPLALSAILLFPAVKPIARFGSTLPAGRVATAFFLLINLAICSLIVETVGALTGVPDPLSWVAGFAIVGSCPVIVLAVLRR